MTKRPFMKIAFFLIGLGSNWLFFTELYPGSVSQAACPRKHAGQDGWLKNDDVFYRAFGFTNLELDNMQGGGAIGNWNYHNTPPYIGNCSNVKFYTTTVGQDLTIDANFGSYSPSPSAAAVTFYDTVSNRIIIAATITYYFGAIRSNGQPTWNRDGSTAYYNCIKKQMLHEIGHTMGLEHPTSSIAGQTVMNGYIGTNDSGNNQPMYVQTCDNNTANSITQYRNNCQPPPQVSQVCV